MAPWKKSYDQPRQHIKEKRHYFSDRGLSSGSYDFSSSHVWMFELDHKESRAWKNLFFWSVVLEKTLESHLNCCEIQPVPWTARRSNESILKQISPEYALEGLMLRLKLQYFGLLMQRTDSFEKTPMLGKIEGGRRDRQRMRWLDGITDSMDMGLSKLRVGDGQGGLVCCNPWGRRVWHDWVTELNWTRANQDSNSAYSAWKERLHTW